MKNLKIIVNAFYIGDIDKPNDESYTFNNACVKFINKSSKGVNLYAFKLDGKELIKDSKFIELFDSKKYKLAEYFLSVTEEEIVINQEADHYLYKEYLLRDKE